MAEQTAAATWEEFERVGLRAGTIRKVESFPEAHKPAYKVWVDFGPLGVRQSSAQIGVLYSPEELIGRQVICATGLGSKRVAGFKTVTGGRVAAPDCELWRRNRTASHAVTV